MRKLSALLTILGLLTLATPVMAGTSDLVAGVNGVATAALDPVFGLINGDNTVVPSLGFADPVVTRIVGLGTGLVCGAVRAVTGAVDAATFLFTEQVGGPYSPDAKIDLVDNLVGTVDGLFAGAPE